MVDLNFSLTGGNADVIQFDGSDGYILTTGLRGLGIPTTDVRITNSAGDGGTWRSTRRGIRELDLPIVVIADDRDSVESKLRRLAAALSDRYGTPKLVATYSDGSSYEIEVHYTGGAETLFGSDAGSTYCRWMLTVQAPQPYWTSQQLVSFSLAYDGSTRGLLPDLSMLKVKTNSVLGSFTIENPGDVDAFPVWTINGKSTLTSITLNGVGFTYTETTAAGDKRTIDTRNATVVDASSVNKYAYLGTAPKLFAIPPGRSTITVAITSADSSTGLSGYFQPRREVLH
jgi:phage-related protein